MTYQPTYHFDPFYSNRLLDIKVGFVEVLSIVKKRLSLTNFKTGLIESINKDFNKLLMMAKGLHSIVLEFDQENALQELPTIEKSIVHFNRIFTGLYKLNFLDNKLLERVCNDILSTYYDIEFELKQKAFSNNVPTNSDKQLIKYASAVSSQSILLINGSTL